MDKIILAGGCFWGVEDLFRKLDGVTNSTVGYTGGSTEHPTYDTVKTGTTGHAEAIEIEFDPQKISLAEILRFFFKMHDPTTLNQQGNDVGSQYRSEIFYSNAVQEKMARKIVQEVNDSGFWKKPIVTRVTPATQFYAAEEYHQDYLKKNPGGYTCHFIRN